MKKFSLFTLALFLTAPAFGDADKAFQEALERNDTGHIRELVLSGKTPKAAHLIQAIKQNNNEALELMVSTDMVLDDIRHAHDTRMTPLIAAIRAKDREAFLILLEAGVDPNFSRTPVFMDSPLQEASRVAEMDTFFYHTLKLLKNPELFQRVKAYKVCFPGGMGNILDKVHYIYVSDNNPTERCLRREIFKVVTEDAAEEASVNSYERGFQEGYKEGANGRSARGVRASKVTAQ